MESALYQMIGRRLRDARESKAWTQTELGERVNLTRTSITNIEAGRQKVPIDTVYDICSVLRILPHDVFPEPEELQAEELNPSIPVEDKNLSPEEMEFIRRVIKKGINANEGDV